MFWRQPRAPPILWGRVARRLSLACGFAGYFACTQYNFRHQEDGGSLAQGLSLSMLYSDFGSQVRALVEPENAHRWFLWLAARSLSVRTWLGLVNEINLPLDIEVFGRYFMSPLGLAAGFDKDAQAVEGLLDMGFGFVEVGTITPQPQPGNPSPRVFRIPGDHIINRYGFPSQGMEVVAQRLQKRKEKFNTNDVDEILDLAMSKSYGPVGVVGVNIGKNKLSQDPIADYVSLMQRLAPYADYMVLNVSSPNTPGLRDLQQKQQLKSLLQAVLAARDQLAASAAGQFKVPCLLVKIAPDLTEQQRADIAEVCLELRVDGMVISNTTTARPPAASLLSPSSSSSSSSSALNANNPDYTSYQEGGGLSGPVLLDPSTALLRDMYVRTQGKLPLIGVGGVSNARDAYRKIRAGASLVQLYTAFAYQGPRLMRDMHVELYALLQADGFASVRDAVGADVPEVKITRRPTPLQTAMAGLPELEPYRSPQQDNSAEDLLPELKQLPKTWLEFILGKDKEVDFRSKNPDEK